MNTICPVKDLFLEVVNWNTTLGPYIACSSVVIAASTEAGETPGAIETEQEMGTIDVSIAKAVKPGTEASKAAVVAAALAIKREAASLEDRGLHPTKGAELVRVLLVAVVVPTPDPGGQEQVLVLTVCSVH
jgi:hypothetical protein